MHSLSLDRDFAGAVILSDMATARCWRGPLAAMAVHALAALAMVVWPVASPPVEPATMVDLVLAAPPAPVAAAADQAEPQPVAASLPVPAPTPTPRPKPPVSVARPVPAPAAIQTDRVLSPDAPSVAPSESSGAAAGTESPAQVAISRPGAGEDAKAAPISSPKPFYPRVARQRGWEGMVVVRVAIDEVGKASQVAVRDSSGHPALDEAAVDAVRQWRFSPARQAGVGVASLLDVPVRFTLNGG